MNTITLYDWKVSISTWKDFDININVWLFPSEQDAEIFLYMKNEIKDHENWIILLKWWFIIEEFKLYIQNLLNELDFQFWQKRFFRIDVAWNIYDLYWDTITYDLQWNLFLFKH